MSEAAEVTAPVDAPVAASEAPVVEATPAPATPESHAKSEDGGLRDRLLARARDRAGLPSNTAEKAPANDNDKPAEPIKAEEATAAANDNGKVEEKKTEAKPADDEAERLAKLVQEDRRLRAVAKQRTAEEAKLKAEREAIENERKANQANLERLQRASEAVGKRDWVGALRALQEDVDPNAAVLEILEQLQEPTPPSPAEIKQSIATTVADALKAEREKAEADAKAAREKAEADKQAEYSKSFETWVGTVNDVFQANVAQFPFINARGLDVSEIDAYCRKTGVVDQMEVLKYFEGRERAIAEKAGYAVRAVAVEAPKPAPTTVTSSWASSSGGRAAPPATTLTGAAKVEASAAAIRARLRAMAK